MSIVSRMLQKEICGAVALTSTAFLALLLFFDLISESRFVTRAGVDGYGVAQILTHLALSAPMHLYELLPICVLIGSVFVMARYAKTSQFTILRTGGLGPGKALRILLSIGLLFTAITFVVGDYVAPWSERSAQMLRAKHVGGQVVAGGGAGAWMRERQGADSVIVSVRALRADGAMEGIRVFQFGPDGRLSRQIRAQLATVQPNAWLMQQAREEKFIAPTTSDALPLTSDSFSSDVSGLSSTEVEPMLQVSEHAEFSWPTSISAEMVNAAILKPDGMSTWQLFNYVSHLQANDQASQKYELELWRKVFYPLGCLVMMILALPFAYLHFRAGGIMGYVFIGILVGISYLLLNNVLGYIGNLRGWSPLLTAAIPGMLYTCLALGIFFQMVRRQ